MLFTRGVLQHSEKDIRKTYDVNVLSHYWIFHAFLPKMIENDKGHVVGVCSMAGLVSLRNIVPYCSSKFAVRGLMQGLENEVFEMTNGSTKVCLNFNLLTYEALFEIIFRLNLQQFILSMSPMVFSNLI